MRVLLTTLLCAGAAFGQGAGRVQFRDWNPPAPTSKPTVSCGSLRALTNYDLSIVSANIIPATSDAPEHCRVRVLIQPKLNIEVNLPSAWNTRFYMFGNGGFAGESFESSGRVADRAIGLKAGFVVASTDTGHSAAEEPGGTFARNRQELLDFGFRSLHLTAETAKTLIRAYYGTGPTKSYFDGCSQGGREGLILAQRFPTDFDGIISGSPAINLTDGNLARAYWMQILAASPIPASKMKLLADTVYAKCDAKDGLKDGLIDDPRRCDFHAAQDLPRCAEDADGATCFRTSEIASIDRIYSDVMSQGKRVFPGWPVGSEVAADNGRSGWIGEELNTADGRPGAWTTYAQGFLGYVDFPQNDPASTIAGFDVNRDPQRVGWVRDILDSTDPDLSAFRQHNGKLIIYFGWADPQLNPLMGVEYYESVNAKIGPSTTDFARLFMVPGMAHCGGGIGTSVFDVATPLLNWVESGTAPNQIAASRVVDGKVVRTRPLCSYPQVARYKGAGSIDDAANFSCTRP
jgi:feruloyl esterase